MGRPRKYKNNAEKQRAYRNRKRGTTVTLRNTASRKAQKPSRTQQYHSAIVHYPSNITQVKSLLELVPENIYYDDIFNQLFGKSKRYRNWFLKYLDLMDQAIIRKNSLLSKKR
jgi:hypothetical protein